MKCYVCSNVETLVAGSWLENHPENFSMEGLYRVVREFCSNHEALSDYHYDSIYNHWHGGKFDQFFKRCGFVAVPSNSSEEIVKLGWELNREIAQEVERQALEEYLDACHSWADELESGNIELEEFKQKIAPELLDNPNSYDTVGEVIAELRRKD